MIHVTLKGGVVRQYEDGATAMDVAKSLGAGLYKAACACKIDGALCDLRTALPGDCALSILTFDDAEGKRTFWHTASHIMAQAVKRLYPQAKLTIGPAVDNGFYYDFDAEEPFTPESLAKIEAEMKKIVKEALPLERFELAPDDAVKIMEEKDEPYKVELIREHAEKGEPISFYKQGEFTELCAGPHLPDTGRVKAFKLTSCTGAYWRGDAKNKMLQRIYGTAFPKQSELDAHLTQLEEAKKRDHNKLGRELELFTTSDVIGQGLPILLPKGARIVQILQRFVEDEEQKRGWLLTKTPFMAKSDLYKISGHWDHYKDGMFVLGDEEKDDEVFALRPMTCPFQYQAYLNKSRSYRDLPLRYNETSTLFRNEASGEMHGLIRVRQFTISEGHLMCTPEQLEDEFKGCLELAIFMLKTVGLYEDVSYRFSQWDPDDREKYIGTPEQWAEAQGVMQKILDHLGLDYAVGVGEAAFYGPSPSRSIRCSRKNSAWSIRTRTAQKRTPISSTAPPSAATSARLRCLSRNTRGHSRCGLRRSRRASCRSPSGTMTRRARFMRSCAARASAWSWMNAARRSAIRYARRSFRKSRICSSSATRRRRAGQYPSVCAGKAISVRWPLMIFWRARCWR